MPREPYHWVVLAGIVITIVGVAAALVVVVWSLRRAGDPTEADRSVGQRIAQRAVEVLPEGPPPTPPAKPVFEAAGPPAVLFPTGVNRYTPVWLADDTHDRPSVLAHRLVGHGYRTVEGYLIREGHRRYGRTTPAGLAVANRNVQFCARCWPAVPVIPGRPLPRRRAS